VCCDKVDSSFGQYVAYLRVAALFVWTNTFLHSVTKIMHIANAWLSTEFLLALP